jgi:peroxiredoxin
LNDFVEAYGIEMPVMLDVDGAVHDDWQLEALFKSGAYPQEWIVGTDGRIAYAAHEFEYDAVITILEQELSGN